MSFLNYISLMRFEIAALGLMVLLLLYKVFSEKQNPLFLVVCVNTGFLVTLLLGCIGHPNGNAFGGMFVMDGTLLLEKQIITFASLLVFLQANQWLRSQENGFEFGVLLLSIVMGMYFMISAGNFIMLYLGLEMATIPLAALVAFDFGRMRSAESAGKMILSSAFSSAILLFGLSLLYGMTGSLDYVDVKSVYGASISETFVLAFILVGFAFKISIVPFHFWTADVYEGAPVAVTSFLSVVSKAASVFVLMNVLYKVFPLSAESWMTVLVPLSAITMTVGNIFAMRQTNVKRFLAFSSITQAGYILIGVASVSAQSMASVIYFLLIYVFSNIAAFTVVAIVSEKTGKEDIGDYKGLYKTNPLLSVAMLLAVFSLAGIPPTAGFFGKLFLLISGASAGMMTLLIIASLNMVVSLYYYLRIVKAMFVDRSENPIGVVSIDLSAKIVLAICVAGILMIGFCNFIFEYIHSFSFGL